MSKQSYIHACLPHTSLDADCYVTTVTNIAHTRKIGNLATKKMQQRLFYKFILMDEAPRNTIINTYICIMYI